MTFILRATVLSVVFVAALTSPGNAAEICGNGVDDDADGLTDDGCFGQVCESPLSCNETGMVSPLAGGLQYRLPPDVAPKVPYGVGIGLRRTYLSQAFPGISAAPTFQALGGFSSSTGPVSPTWPAHVANDVALLVIETAGTQPASLSSPQGFALLGSRADSVDIDGTILTVYWKRATGAAEPAPTVADSGDHQIAQIITFRNVATTGNPWDRISGNATDGFGATDVWIPGAVTSVPNTRVVSILATSSFVGSSMTNADIIGYTEHVDGGSADGNGGGIAIASGVKLTAGRYGLFTGTASATVRLAKMSIALRPVDNAPAWKKPMGDRWTHTYQTWVTKTGTAPSSTLVVRTSQGQDVRATYASSLGGWDNYTPQTGFHVHQLRQRQSAPNELQMRLLTGETLVYNSSGRLIEVWDTLATPNKVLVTYDGSSQVSTVTDASTKRRLLFGYTANQLTSVQFQIYLSGAWTAQHTTSYGYSSGLLSTVTIGGSLAQTNVYTTSHLTQIQDAAGKNILGVSYNESAGRVARLAVPSGTLGYDYDSTRPSCSGKTVLYFNLGNATSCDVDADCGSGYLCGGKTGSGATGQCFRGARCLTVTSPSEDVITAVTALGPPSESCEGACLEASSYVWNTGAGILDLKAIQDGSGNYTVKAFNANGLPTTISYGDPDTDPANGNGARELFISYNATFPGKVAEIRRQSDLITPKGCAELSGSGSCARTINTWNTDGKLTQVDEIGYTRDGTDTIVGYTYTTAYSFDSKGRLTQIDGPLAGSNDVTQFTYYGSVGALRDDFLDEYKRKKDSTNFLTQRALDYDFWGNPVMLQDADGTITCMTFDAARGYLNKRSEAMAGQADCTANAADLVTGWSRDSALRLTRIVRPDGSCLFYEFDAAGRLQRTKRRDDCNAGSSGDTQELVYDAEGLLTEIQTYDASSTLTAKQAFAYFDSRHLQKLINPVDPSKWTGINYDPRGLVNQIDHAGGLGKTVYNRAGLPGADGRVTSVDKYKSVSTFDSWNLLYAWFGDQTKVTDGDAKATETVRDDLGRIVKIISPDMTGPRLQMYDNASRLWVSVDAFGVSGSTRYHAFTYDNLGRPLTSDFGFLHADGTCFGTTNPPEIERVYDALPSGMSCPISGGGCSRLEGRLAYERVRLMCSSALGGDNSLDQETFYAYDDAGRVITEYIRDDAGRVAQQSFFWTKNGALSEMYTPASSTLQWSYGSAGNNSDADLVTAQSRGGTANPVTTEISWSPFGPLASYKHEATYGGVKTRTRITRNLAYRTTGVYHETSTGGTILQSMVTSEDAKGRIIKRDYSTGALADSYFLYDDQDRLLCETTNSVGSCPTSGSNIKNSHTASPPFKNAGDWKQLKRPIPGHTGLTHDFSIGSTNHRITQINQDDSSPPLRTTLFSYTALGARSSDNNGILSNDDRAHTYDQRHNKKSTTGWVRQGGTWYTYSAVSAFDARNRRVFKSFTANAVTSTWYFYYDPLDRLTEIKYTPNIASASTYQTFVLFWLGDRLTAQYQIDAPSGTLSRRYTMTDETNRPLELWSRPTSGDTTRVWAINPSAWGFDTNLVGATVFQPVLFAGQFQDPETTAYQNDGTTVHRPALVHNGFRAYDPFTGSYMQIDPLAPETWSSYGYVDSNPVGRTDRRGLQWEDDGWDGEGETVVIEGDAPDDPNACWDAGFCFPGGWGGGSGGPGWGTPPGGGGGGGGNPPPPPCGYLCRMIKELRKQLDSPLNERPIVSCEPTSLDFQLCQECKDRCIDRHSYDDLSATLCVQRECRNGPEPVCLPGCQQVRPTGPRNSRFTGTSLLFGR